MKKALVIGLTGGIGSGKSAAADEFERLGATIVDADRIAHELTASGGRAIPAIRREFGAALIAPGGEMDRRAMRELVFADGRAKNRLEAILHPMIRGESRRQIDAATGPYVVHVVPLLVESGEYRDRVDRVLVVDAPEALQIARVRERSGLDEDAIQAILRAQASRDRRLAAADDVIDNSGSLEQLRSRVGALHQNYLQFPGQ